MKKINLLIIALCFCFGVNAQEQLTNTGNIQIHPGASVTLFGNFNNNGSVTDSGQAVSFNGNAIISGTSVTTFRNLIINNSLGVTLQQSVLVSNSLALTSGPLTLNSKTITVNNSASSATGRTNGYIVSEQTDNAGKIIWRIDNNTGAHVYPFGTASGIYIPFTLDLTAGNIGNVTVSTYPTAVNNTPYPTTPILVTNVNNNSGDNSANTVDRFWQVDKDGASGTVTLTFTATGSEIGTITNLTAQRWNPINSTWEAPLSGQSPTATSATVPGVTTFGVWALANSNFLLPIELLSFTAVLNDSHVDLNWITESETNSDYFTVEKTLDGTSYEPFAVIDGAGNSTMTLNYSTLDNNPYQGISYYHLRQTDFDGSVSYSNMVAIDLTNSFDVNVFPNPASENMNILITGAEGQTVSVSLKDIFGKEYYSGTVKVESNDYLFSLNKIQALAQGIYMIRVSNNNNNDSKNVKVIVN